DWQWNTGALGILIAWLNLVLYIRKMPRFGIYVVMFTDIFFTFSRFFLVFFLFILSFSIAFYLLMQNQIGFDNLGKTILKTTVMMIGEFEYADTFDNQYEPDNKLNASQQIFYNAATYAVFVFFLAIMSIIIMNLLVGLAVDDIKAVQEQASLNRMAMQVELALDVEAILPMVLTRKFVIKSEIYYPNPDRSKKTYFISKMFDNIWITRDQLNRALDPELDQWDKIYKKQEGHTDVSMVTVKTKLKELKSKTVKIEAMLGAIMRKLQIDQDESSLLTTWTLRIIARMNTSPMSGDEIAT
uniref:Ion_trans domain-containing protein n=1 Tax=Macrostomum lignano TaxID=282301 RepID=A0A1I8FTD3_9PLAT